MHTCIYTYENLYKVLGELGARNSAVLSYAYAPTHTCTDTTVCIHADIHAYTRTPTYARIKPGLQLTLRSKLQSPRPLSRTRLLGTSC